MTDKVLVISPAESTTAKESEANISCISLFDSRMPIRHFCPMQSSQLEHVLVAYCAIQRHCELASPSTGHF